MLRKAGLMTLEGYILLNSLYDNSKAQHRYEDSLTLQLMGKPPEYCEISKVLQEAKLKF